MMETAVQNIGVIGNTIKVASGHYVDLKNPDPWSIDLNSIAHALSHICRYGGHCPKFYSVAEHSIHAMRLALFKSESAEVLRAVLMHDATEAFLGDIVRPLKLILPDYRAVEDNMEHAIAERFGIDFAIHKVKIKLYDNMMLKAEKKWLWPEDTHEWTGLASIEDCRPNWYSHGEPMEHIKKMFIYYATQLGLA